MIISSKKFDELFKDINDPIGIHRFVEKNDAKSYVRALSQMVVSYFRKTGSCKNTACNIVEKKVLCVKKYDIANNSPNIARLDI